MTKAKQIDEDDITQMLQYFEKFVRNIENLCSNTDMNDVWMNSNDVCQLLKIDKCTLMRYRTNGLIRYSKIRNKFYYKKSDIEELIARSYIKRENHRHE